MTGRTSIIVPFREISKDPAVGLDRDPGWVSINTTGDVKLDYALPLVCLEEIGYTASFTLDIPDMDLKSRSPRQSPPALPTPAWPLPRASSLAVSCISPASTTL